MFDQTNEVNAGGKKFQVLTHFIESPAKILSAVSSNSMVLYEKNMVVENLNPAQIQEKVYIFHRETVADIELLFYMADKVRSIHHPVSNNKLGIVFLKRNLIDEAVEQFKFALERDRNMVEAITNLGIAYFIQKNYSLALETFQRGKALKVEHADLYNYAGQVNFELNKLDAALLDYERALNINPDYADANLNMGLLYLKMIFKKIEQNDAAGAENFKKLTLKYFILAAELMPPGNIKIFDKVNEFINSNAFNHIPELIEIIKKNNPPLFDYNLEHEFYLKFMFGGKGKDDHYIEDYIRQQQLMISEHPDYADLRNNLGVVYLIQCRNLFLKALDEFREALKLNSDFKKAEKNLKLAENDGKGFLILLRAILK